MANYWFSSYFFFRPSNLPKKGIFSNAGSTPKFGGRSDRSYVIVCFSLLAVQFYLFFRCSRFFSRCLREANASLVTTPPVQKEAGMTQIIRLSPFSPANLCFFFFVFPPDCIKRDEHDIQQIHFLYITYLIYFQTLFIGDIDIELYDSCHH